MFLIIRLYDYLKSLFPTPRRLSYFLLLICTVPRIGDCLSWKATLCLERALCPRIAAPPGLFCLPRGLFSRLCPGLGYPPFQKMPLAREPERLGTFVRLR